MSEENEIEEELNGIQCQIMDVRDAINGFSETFRGARKEYDQRLKETMYDFHCCYQELMAYQREQIGQNEAAMAFSAAAQVVVAMNLKRVAECLGDDTALHTLEKSDD